MLYLKKGESIKKGGSIKLMMIKKDDKLRHVNGIWHTEHINDFWEECISKGDDCGGGFRITSKMVVVAPIHAQQMALVVMVSVKAPDLGLNTMIPVKAIVVV
ncbi:hypothetical protein L1887_15151 [Cichorium endivia]|nr:hypothetical protein L1887_15151 [Cichorium endivia]